MRESQQRENPSQANKTKRTTYDRNSDLNQGHPEELLPDSRFVWNGVFRPPIGFRGPFSNGGGLRGRIQGEEIQQRTEAQRDRRSSTGTQGRLTPCPICNEPGLSCDKLGCWTILSDKKAIAAVIKSHESAILDNSQREPKYSAGFSAVIGVTISLGALVGLVIYELVRHGK